MSEDWESFRIADLVEEDRPICYGVLKPGDYCDEGIPLVRIVDIDGDRLHLDGLFRITPKLDREFQRSRLFGGEIVISIQGTIGRVAIIPLALNGANISRTLARLAIKTDHCPAFIRLTLLSDTGQRLLADAVMGTTRDSLNIGALRDIKLLLPTPEKQRRIAEILSTIDQAIEHTEAHIAKLQQIKAGLMQDLFTRGVTPDGKLRPPREEAPDLYHESPLGWIPKGWRCLTVDQLLAKTSCPMRSGPFGSALLKDELVEDGVPLLGIDNVFCERFSPIFRRFVSRFKFGELSRYAAFPGDVVITIMGTVGRCCVIPALDRPLLSSKHLWTMTFDPDLVFPELVCWQLNWAPWVKRWFARHSQGAVMEAIQSSTLRNLELPVPEIDEQNRIRERHLQITSTVQAEVASLTKLGQQKQGLMQDLLTGQVKVHAA